MNTDSPRLLPDAPASVDEFGGHSAVASAIANVVRTERGGHAIALEGDWGAGKSTVVGILQSHLSADNERCFVFDAWAHQGDPLRRSFLESLTGYLLDSTDAGSAWVGPSWQEKLEELAGRRRTTTRRTRTEIREVAKYAALGALLVPLGLLIFNHAIDTTAPSTAIDRRMLAVGVILALAPVFGIVLGALVRRFSKEKRDRDRAVGAGLLDPLVGNQNVDEHSDSWETSDPTSIEFERTFRDLMADALKEEARRLVIVFDNLDRVDPTAALSILGTMQTFLGPGDSTSEPWRPRLWVIVPFDRVGLTRLWETDAIGTDEGSTDQDLGTQTQLAAQQLDKLFLVTFRVPPLLLSDWRRYLLRLLEQALPDETTAMRERLPSVYGAYRALVPSAGRDRPTPRKLKQLVNEIAALRLQRGDIALPTLAYFVLCCRYQGGVNDKLLAGDAVPDQLRALLGEDIERQLAALHYGRPEADALHMLLSDPLERALIVGDTRTLQTLAEVPGMWDVAEALPFSEWWSDDGETIGQALATLEEAGLLSDGDQDGRRLLASVATSLPRDKQLSVRSDRAGRGIAKLVSGASAPVTLKQVLARFSDPADAEIRDSAVDLAEGIAGFVHGLRESANALQECDPIHLAVSPAGEIELAAWLSDRSDELLAGLVATRNDLPAVEAAAVEKLTSEPAEVARAVPILRLQYPDAEFETLRAATVETFAGEPAPAEIGALLQTLHAFGDLASTDLATLVTNGTLHHHFAIALNDHQHADVAGELAFAIASHDVTIPMPTSDRRSQEGHTALINVLASPDQEPHELVLDGMARGFADQSNLDHLLELGRDSARKGAARRILQRMAHLDDCSSFTASILAGHWFELRQLVGADALAELAERHRPGGEFEKAATGVTLNNSNASLAIQVLEHELVDADSVVAWTDTYLKAQTEQDWLKALNKADDRVGILLARWDAGLRVECDDRFEKALRMHIEAVADGSAKVPARFRDRLDDVLDSLAAARLPVLLEELAGSLASRSQLVAELVDSWGKVLGKREAFRRADQVLLLAAKAAVGDEPIVIDWARQMLRQDPSMVSEASDDRREYLHSNVADALSRIDDSTDAQLRTAIEDLARDLGQDVTAISDSTNGATQLGPRGDEE